MFALQTLWGKSRVCSSATSSFGNRKDDQWDLLAASQDTSFVCNMRLCLKETKRTDREERLMRSASLCSMYTQAHAHTCIHTHVHTPVSIPTHHNTCLEARKLFYTNLSPLNWTLNLWDLQPGSIFCQVHTDLCIWMLPLLQVPTWEMFCYWRSRNLQLLSTVSQTDWTLTFFTFVHLGWTMPVCLASE